MQAWIAPTVPSLPADESGPREVRVFDTAAQSIIDLGPKHGTARMYVCGITPYDATHMGHANTYVTFDLLNRVWRDSGLDVRYVQNITDVDDPLLERADAVGRQWEELAATEVDLFRADMEALNVIPPDHFQGVVESINLVIDLIDELQQRGAIYRIDDPEYPDLYFAVHSDRDFGEVGHLLADEARTLSAERGGDPDRPGKQDPLDCLVWRQARPGEPAWDSPFGRGRPGWHIECTAIALEHLGTDFDVQGGGNDLIFPHHEMCAAGARVATGKPFARSYVHGGMVGLDGEKMSKSLGNLVKVSVLRESGVDPMAIRLALLANRYRDEWSWTDELLTHAQQRLAHWREAVARNAAAPAAEAIAAIRNALNNDLDAPAALSAVDTWAAGPGSDPAAPQHIADTVDALLGIRL